jgi:hypothetical protein
MLIVWYYPSYRDQNLPEKNGILVICEVEDYRNVSFSIKIAIHFGKIKDRILEKVINDYLRHKLKFFLDGQPLCSRLVYQEEKKCSN